MKTSLLSAAVAILFTTVTLQCMAQPEPPQKPRREHGPREAATQPLQQITAFTGTVNDWINNEDYIYDGFYLQISGSKVLVKFPPHLGAQLVKSIKSGGTVTVNGVERVNPEGIREIKMVNINVGGQTIADTPPMAASIPETETSVTGNGKITGLRMDKEGRINGYIIDSKIIIKTPPHIAAQLNGLLSNGSTISYTGLKRPVNNGEEMAGNYSIVHCRTITINGTQYLTD